jgi:predicted GIY-YIG superfamily endonuclease
MAFNNTTLYEFNSLWYEIPVVYGILNNHQQVIYIGQTDNLKRRMAEHQANALHLMHLYAPAYVVGEIIADDKTRCERERQLIREYNPPCNLC